jgi:hypothetical protein
VVEVATGRERAHLGVVQPRPPVSPRPLPAVGFPVVAGAVSPTLAFSSDGRTVAWTNGGTVHFGDLETEQEIGKLQGHDGTVGALAFAADGRSLLTGGSDTTVLRWDAQRLPRPRRDTPPLRAETIEAAWASLVGNEPGPAFESILLLSADPKLVVPFLRERLRPATPVDAKVIDGLIADLRADRFVVRQKATDELAKLGDLAVPALSKLLTGDASLEERRRAEQLLDKLTGGPLTGEQVRLVRALEVLERQGTTEARAVLETLARGAPGALPTREAQAALERLRRR